jgi:WhiB family redox-sensing transcriptional regulator
VSARTGIAQGSHQPTPARRDTAWKERAACQGLPDEFFFPPPKVRILQETRRICAGCEVRLDCLAYALNFDAEGIWGGLSEQERRNLKRRSKEHT